MNNNLHHSRADNRISSSLFAVVVDKEQTHIEFFIRKDLIL